MAYRSELYSDARIAANDYCSVLHLNRLFRMEGDTLLAEFLGVDVRDQKWIAPDGRDCSRMVEMSSIGGFSSQAWTFDGWILDDESMANLREEYPQNFRSPVDRPMPTHS